jgi:hypothetical protein
VKSKTILIIAIAIVLSLLLSTAIVVIKNKFGTDESNESKITGLSLYTDIS